jgi:hypothetical protein
LNSRSLSTVGNVNVDVGVNPKVLETCTRGFVPLGLWESTFEVAGRRRNVYPVHWIWKRTFSGTGKDNVSEPMAQGSQRIAQNSSEHPDIGTAVEALDLSHRDKEV